MSRFSVRAAVVALVAAATLIALPTAGAGATTSSSSASLAINWQVKASTHLKKLGMTVRVPKGSFKGSVNISTGKLKGDLTLPAAKSTIKLGGSVPLATATFKMAETRPVTGKVDLTTLKVTTKASFNIQVTDLEAGGVPVNLVGDHCATSTPITLTMSGKASLTGSSTFKGSYTIPSFAHCELLTAVLDAAVSGPGNSFAATFSPKKK